jgi:hypothetical protein
MAVFRSGDSVYLKIESPEEGGLDYNDYPSITLGWHKYEHSNAIGIWNQIMDQWMKEIFNPLAFSLSKHVGNFVHVIPDNVAMGVATKFTDSPVTSGLNTKYGTDFPTTDDQVIDSIEKFDIICGPLGSVVPFYNPDGHDDDGRPQFLTEGNSFKIWYNGDEIAEFTFYMNYQFPCYPKHRCIDLEDAQLGPNTSLQFLGRKDFFQMKLSNNPDVVVEIQSSFTIPYYQAEKTIHPGQYFDIDSILSFRGDKATRKEFYELDALPEEFDTSIRMCDCCTAKVRFHYAPNQRFHTKHHHMCKVKDAQSTLETADVPEGQEEAEITFEDVDEIMRVLDLDKLKRTFLAMRSMCSMLRCENSKLPEDMKDLQTHFKKLLHVKPLWKMTIVMVNKAVSTVVNARLQASNEPMEELRAPTSSSSSDGEKAPDVAATPKKKVGRKKAVSAEGGVKVPKGRGSGKIQATESGGEGGRVKIPKGRGRGKIQPTDSSGEGGGLKLLRGRGRAGLKIFRGGRKPVSAQSIIRRDKNWGPTEFTRGKPYHRRNPNVFQQSDYALSKDSKT